MSSKLTELKGIKITTTLPRWQWRCAALMNLCKMDGRTHSLAPDEFGRNDATASW
jgi:hypothetical protein